MVAQVVELNRDNFHEIISQDEVLVDFWGRECRACMQLMPFVDGIADRHPALVVGKLEAPKARRICMEYGVMGLPSFILFREGKEVSRISSRELTSDELDGWLMRELSQSEKGED